MTDGNASTFSVISNAKNFVYLEAVNRLVADFQSNPQKYFAEAELQYEFYSILKTLKAVNTSLQTRDGVTVATVHPEYPSVNRVQLKSGKGYRTWFDVAILNPSFINSSDYKTVWARNERDAKSGPENVLAAFEFKYFPVKRTHDFSSVEQDCLKLSLCEEVKEKYVLTFSSYDIEAYVMQGIDIGSAMLLWTTPRALYFRSPDDE